MSGSVTLPGASGAIVTVQAGAGSHLWMAQIIANTILTASVNGSLAPSAVVTITGGVPQNTAPPTVSGKDNILFLVGDGDTGGGPGDGTYTIPTGYNYVVDLLTGPETISGSNVQIIAYNQTSAASIPAGDFVITGNSSVAADPNNSYAVTISGSFNESTGDGNNTITATGTGTIGGGTGTNTYFISPTVPGSGILLQSNGIGDTATVTDPSGGDATVQSSANDFTLGSIGLVTIYAALQGDDDTVTGGSADTNVTAAGSHNIVLGGSPGGAMSYVSNGTGDTIATFGASTVNVSLNGSGSDVGTGDLLLVGSGVANADISGAFETVGGGTVGSATNVTINAIGLATNELVLGYLGSLSIVDNGTNDTIAPFGASSSTVSLGGSHNLLFAGSHNLTATVGGAGDTIAGTSGAMTITATSAAVVFENSGALNFIGGAGSSSIVGANGTPTAMTVGAGGVTFWSGTNAVTSVFGGAGATTLLGASGSQVYFSDPTSTDGGLQFSAGYGNETLNASGSTTNDFYGAGANSVGAGSTVFGNDSIVGGSGDDTFTAGGGSDTFTSGAGDNQFVFFASQTDGQHDYITNWTSNDSLFLLNYSNADSANTLMANSTSDGGSLTITLSDSTQITFTNVAAGDTSAFNGKILYS